MKKSRAFSPRFRLPGKWVNIILLAVFILVIALIAISRYTGKTVISRDIDISISPQFENLFGAELAGSLIKDFEKQRPDLRITKANEAADILFFDDLEFGRLRSGLKLLSLSPYIAANKQEGETAIEQDVPGQDTQWALPLASFMDLLFYNIDILQAAGFDRPPKTRAEFLTAARAVANAGEGQNSAYSFALDLPRGARQTIYPWIWAAGGEIRVGDEAAGGGVPVLSRAALDIIAFFAQLQREGLLAPGQEIMEDFAKGKIAMITSSARDIVFLQRQNINFGITAIPGTAQAKNRLCLSKIYVGISADSALPDEAWAFLSFLEGKSPILAEALSAIPGSLHTAFPDEYILKNPLYSKAWDIFEAAEIVEYRSDPSDEETERLVMDALEALR